MIPRRGNTSEEKRHMKTVPVKILKPEASLRKRNVDRGFAKSFIDDMFEVANIFGALATLFLSNDDKASVPLGLAAASLQALILMHLSYKVTLLDHDFVVGAKHKQIPSVYGVCEITSQGKVSYAGGTFIRIRSGKYDTSSAATHAYDTHELFEKGKISGKPILLIEIDGAPDEAFRFPKTLAAAVSLCKELQSEVLLHGVNASGLSAFNLVEKCMGPLSHATEGVILPHDHFGNHLSSNGETTDPDLKKKNFQKAAEILRNVLAKHTV